MKNETIKINGSGNEEGGAMRWILLVLGTLVAALLVATLETGRVHAQLGSSFFFTEARVRVITPNGDGKNDVAILCFDNPQFSGVTGDILDLRGQKVAAMTYVQNAAVALGCPTAGGPVPNPEGLTWDGRADGAFVHGGVYIYQIKSEDSAVTGTILVVR